MYRPLAERVLVKLESAEGESVTAGGIYLTTKKDDGLCRGVVESVGPDVRRVQVGETIVFKSYSGDSLDKSYSLVKAEDILAIIE